MNDQWQRVSKVIVVSIRPKLARSARGRKLALNQSFQRYTFSCWIKGTTALNTTLLLYPDPGRSESWMSTASSVYRTFNLRLEKENGIPYRRKID